MTTTKSLNAMTKSQAATNRKAGRPKVVSIPRQRPSYYIWPKIPEGTADLQEAMGYICGHANFTIQQLTSNQWIKVVYSIWSSRNKGWAGVSFGCSTLAAIGNPLEAVGQRKYSSGGM